MIRGRNGGCLAAAPEFAGFIVVIVTGFDVTHIEWIVSSLLQNINEAICEIVGYLDFLKAAFAVYLGSNVDNIGKFNNIIDEFVYSLFEIIICVSMLFRDRSEMWRTTL